MITTPACGHPSKEGNCVTCGRELTSDEIGLSKKLINRGTTQFKCAACLAAYYQIRQERLRELIEQYRAQGCTLFE
jgi:predicted RNA-binding Zn-ribbon protein involved in translation (DUF1610 family)